MSRLISALLATLMVFVALDAQAAEPSLALGDKAPKLSAEEWLRGDAFKKFERDHVYVVEFWATWCGPCRESMPHLSHLEEHYADKNVHILGVTAEDRKTVDDFLAKQGEVSYALLSDPDQSMEADYMKAFGVSGIPHAFIVGKKGRIEWVGHPSQMDAVLAAVVEDRFHSDEYIAWKANHDALSVEYKEATAAQDWERAIHVSERLIREHQRDEALYGSAANHQLQLAQIFLKQSDDTDAAYAFATEAMWARWDDASFLNNLSWFITTEETVKVRDLELAMKMSVRSNLLSNGDNPAYLDTLARIYYEEGQLELAVRYQRDAVAAMKHPDGGISDTLAKYEREHAKQTAPNPIIHERTRRHAPPESGEI